jgi:small subunit ribosomal protein S16
MPVDHPGTIAYLSRPILSARQAGVLFEETEAMAVHIRLARAGTTKTPFYRIVVADQRSPRGGRFIERLGTWDPRRPELRLDPARVKHWIDRGAQPSSTVALLLKQPSIAVAAAAPAADPAAQK